MAKAVYEDDPSDEDQIAPVKRSNKPVYEDDTSEMDALEEANKGASLAPIGPRAMPTRPGQSTSGSTAKPVAKQKPNFDPALRSSESVGNSQLSTLNKQLQKAPENAGRMAARQALEKKAADTAKSQAIIDRLSRRTRPYMKDEAGNDMKRGGVVKKMASGGSVSSASSRGDGIAQRGKTRGKMC
ncbi:hypothetical protein UFOVP654_16 [uncultured Caudovirales phage]|uniref:Uncharacterized protein n=1 Tax=uncultured Caudovirales phage TaxID=2100421 RepID=A0A6J5N808_9CAUD|nr:hypothetical protein UFOVP654_16 [uncultured Caudovirales phage]